MFFQFLVEEQLLLEEWSQVYLKLVMKIEIVGIRETKKSVCTGVEMFRKLLDSGEAGDNVGVLIERC